MCVVEPRKCSLRHKPETIRYCPHSIFFSPSYCYSSSQQQSCTYLGNPPLLCYMCFSTLPVIILKMVGSTSQSVYAIPSSCGSTSRLLLGLVPKPVLRKVIRVSHSPIACPSWASHSALPSSLHLQLVLPLLRNLLWG